MATPAFRFLRHHFPQARIDCVAPPAMAGLQPFFPWLDEIIPFRCPWSPAYREGTLSNPRQLWRLVFKLRRNRYDWAFGLHWDMRDIVFLFLTGASHLLWSEASGCSLTSSPTRDSPMLISWRAMCSW
jgi:ADP-heptose:LPS heptosyltransferase